jgi:hypothetical protein
MTLAQKKVFLNDVLYVLEQAKAFREYRERGFKQSLLSHPFEQTIHNALLESSLAFLRKVNEFFGSKGEASIRAFIPDYPLSWLWEKDDCTLLNERVMHLSLREAKEGKYDWSAFLDAHLPEAERRFQGFINRLKSEQPELFSK